MTELLAVPLKKPSEVEISKPLKNLIASAYSSSGSNGAQDYSEAVAEFSKLRNTAIWKVFEKYESSLDIIYNYYDQICALETKIPIQELQVPFKWKDAFDKGTIFGGRMSLTLSSLPYEKVCVLFNIAALQSAVAATQSLDNDDGLKMAAKLFQQSAGILALLKSAAPAAIPQEPTPDLNPETLNVLSSLMIAQAQEIFIVKAIRDNMKDQIVAKLCCQCEELYSDVLKLLQKENLRQLWEKEWIPTVAGKQAGFHAMTMFYQSLVCRANKQVGIEIARLQKAVELFKAAQSRSGKANLFEEYANRAQRNLIESKKDNDFIYNEMIPDVNSLEAPGKAQLAKAIPPPAGRMYQDFKDLFANLVPVALHNAITSSEARKTEIVNAEIQKLRESTQTLNSILSSLNLPAAIEVTAGGNSLPPSLTEKANDVRAKGGIANIRVLVNELPELLNRNREILDEAERMLNEERDSDNQLRTQFKEKWTRTASDKLTGMFRTNASKYREIINNAIAADRVVREKFDKHQQCMELLSKSSEDIQNAIPAGGACVANSPSVTKLRQLMETVETIKAERDVIESELKSATLDMKDQFMQALAQDGAINEPALSASSIGRVLAPLQQQTQDSIQRQESLVAEIQTAHSQFSAESGGCAGSREQLLSQLASAYDIFTELLNNLKEGTKFYNDLTEILVGFQNKISDYCFARKAEKEELMKDLTRESSRPADAASTPNIPTHHSTTPSQPAATAANAAAQGVNVPYPVQFQGMPLPYGANQQAPYPTYQPPPMPQSFNPYATMPYPSSSFGYQFPQGPPMQHYGTYPGNMAHQQQFQQQQQPPQNPQNPYGGGQWQ